MLRYQSGYWVWFETKCPRARGFKSHPWRKLFFLYFFIFFLYFYFFNFSSTPPADEKFLSEKCTFCLPSRGSIPRPFSFVSTSGHLLFLQMSKVYGKWCICWCIKETRGQESLIELSYECWVGVKIWVEFIFFWFFFEKYSCKNPLVKMYFFCWLIVTS